MSSAPISSLMASWNSLMSEQQSPSPVATPRHEEPSSDREDYRGADDSFEDGDSFNISAADFEVGTMAANLRKEKEIKRKSINSFAPRAVESPEVPKSRRPLVISSAISSINQSDTDRKLGSVQASDAEIFRVLTQSERKSKNTDNDNLSDIDYDDDPNHVDEQEGSGDSDLARSGADTIPLKDVNLDGVNNLDAVKAFNEGLPPETTSLISDPGVDGVGAFAPANVTRSIDNAASVSFTDAAEIERQRTLDAIMNRWLTPQPSVGAALPAASVIVVAEAPVASSVVPISSVSQSLAELASQWTAEAVDQKEELDIASAPAVERKEYEDRESREEAVKGDVETAEQEQDQQDYMDDYEDEYKDDEFEREPDSFQSDQVLNYSINVLGNTAEDSVLRGGDSDSFIGVADDDNQINTAARSEGIENEGGGSGGLRILTAVGSASMVTSVPPVAIATTLLAASLGDTFGAMAGSGRGSNGSGAERRLVFSDLAADESTLDVVGQPQLRAVPIDEMSSTAMLLNNMVVDGAGSTGAKTSAPNLLETISEPAGLALSLSHAPMRTTAAFRYRDDSDDYDSYNDRSMLSNLRDDAEAEIGGSRGVHLGHGSTQNSIHADDNDLASFKNILPFPSIPSVPGPISFHFEDSKSSNQYNRDQAGPPEASVRYSHTQRSQSILGFPIEFLNTEANSFVASSRLSYASNPTAVIYTGSEVRPSIGHPSAEQSPLLRRRDDSAAQRTRNAQRRDSFERLRAVAQISGAVDSDPRVAELHAHIAVLNSASRRSRASVTSTMASTSLSVSRGRVKVNRSEQDMDRPEIQAQRSLSRGKKDASTAEHLHPLSQGGASRFANETVGSAARRRRTVVAVNAEKVRRLEVLNERLAKQFRTLEKDVREIKTTEVGAAQQSDYIGKPPVSAEEKAPSFRSSARPARSAAVTHEQTADTPPRAVQSRTDLRSPSSLRPRVSSSSPAAAGPSSSGREGSDIEMETLFNMRKILVEGSHLSHREEVLRAKEEALRVRESLAEKLLQFPLSGPPFNVPLPPPHDAASDSTAVGDKESGEVHSLRLKVEELKARLFEERQKQQMDKRRSTTDVDECIPVVETAAAEDEACSEKVKHVDGANDKGARTDAGGEGNEDEEDATKERKEGSNNESGEHANDKGNQTAGAAAGAKTAAPRPKASIKILVAKDEYDRLLAECISQEALISGFQRENEKLATALKQKEHTERSQKAKFFDEQETTNKELNRLRNVLGEDPDGDTPGFVRKSADILRQELNLDATVRALRERVAIAESGAGLRERELHQTIEKLRAENRILLEGVAATKAKAIAEYGDSISAVEQQNILLKKEVSDLRDRLVWYVENQELLEVAENEKDSLRAALGALKKELRKCGVSAGAVEKIVDANTASSTKLKKPRALEGGNEDTNTSNISITSNAVNSTIASGAIARRASVSRNPADVKKIKELETVVRQLQDSIRNRNPDSIANLIQAASTSESVQAERARVQEDAQAAQVELALAKDGYDKRLRSLRQEHEKVKAQYEARIEVLLQQQSGVAVVAASGAKAGAKSTTSSALGAKENSSTKNLTQANAKIKSLEDDMERLRNFYTRKIEDLQKKAETQMRALKRGSGGVDDCGGGPDDLDSVDKDKGGGGDTEEGFKSVPGLPMISAEQYETKLSVLQSQLSVMREELEETKRALAAVKKSNAGREGANLSTHPTVEDIVSAPSLPPVATAATATAPTASEVLWNGKELQKEIDSRMAKLLADLRTENSSDNKGQSVVIAAASSAGGDTGPGSNAQDREAELLHLLLQAQKEALVQSNAFASQKEQLLHRLLKEEAHATALSVEVEALRKEVQKPESPEMQRFRTLETQLRQLEGRMSRRERELEAAMEEGRAAAKMEKTRMQSLHEQELREKDEQLLRLQHQLENLIVALRSMQKQDLSQSPTSVVNSSLSMLY